jgi:hypothetical protein
LTEPKDKESFKVVDRRLFNESGEMRKDVAEQTERDHAAADVAAAKIAKQAQKQAVTGSENAVGGNAADAGQAAQHSQHSPQGSLETQPGQAAGNPNRHFQMLVDFMARNAAMLMGGYADPRTGQPMIDLEGAREMIDMLDALRETTRGNLAAEDDKLLLEVLGSLKLSFMEISKAAAAAMKEKAAKTRP